VNEEDPERDRATQEEDAAAEEEEAEGFFLERSNRAEQQN
jgi:hypothetical protein